MRIFSGRLGSREAVCMCVCAWVRAWVGVRVVCCFCHQFIVQFSYFSRFFSLFGFFFAMFLACWFVCFPGNLFHWTFVCVLQLQMQRDLPVVGVGSPTEPPLPPPSAHYFLFELAVGGTRSLGALFEVVWLQRCCSDLRCIGFSSSECRVKLKKLVASWQEVALS